MRIIKLSRGKEAIVDDSDYETASAWKWYAVPMASVRENYYAARSTGNSTAYLHRLITGAKKGEVVDHINGNGLDNRRSNLRVGTIADNCVNKRYSSSSGYRGVFKQKNRWRAHIYRDGKKYDLGSFIEIEDAAMAYDKKAIELHGKFAITNYSTGVK